MAELVCCLLLVVLTDTAVTCSHLVEIAAMSTFIGQVEKSTFKSTFKNP